MDSSTGRRGEQLAALRLRAEEHGVIPEAKALAALLRRRDFSEFYRLADDFRRETKGDAILIRAILEFSNHCRRRCRYCGLNSENRALSRYRLSPAEMVETAAEAARAGYRTIVLQSGEDPWFTPEILADVVREIKKTGAAVTVSAGEMRREDYRILREAGADRYLMKHETADERIYRSLHPCGTLENRVRGLRDLKELGFEVGSGFMIGLPGQTEETIARDLLLLLELGCDMAGIGPFVPHPETALRDLPHGSVAMTSRAVALARILMPFCNLPATTALGVLDGEEKNAVFSRGANVIMRKVTPSRVKRLYQIYPSELRDTDIAAERRALEGEIRAMGRVPV